MLDSQVIRRWLAGDSQVTRRWLAGEWPWLESVWYVLQPLSMYLPTHQWEKSLWPAAHVHRRDFTPLVQSLIGSCYFSRSCFILTTVCISCHAGAEHTSLLAVSCGPFSGQDCLSVHTGTWLYVEDKLSNNQPLRVRSHGNFPQDAKMKVKAFQKVSQLLAVYQRALHFQFLVTSCTFSFLN